MSTDLHKVVQKCEVNILYFLEITEKSMMFFLGSAKLLEVLPQTHHQAFCLILLSRSIEVCLYFGVIFLLQSELPQ